MTDRLPSTSERVKAICQELYNKTGTKPSVRKVLSMLPDIRSTSTVHKPYAQWWKELQGEQRALLDQRGLSEDFIKALMNEVSRLNRESEERHQAGSEDAIEQRDQALEDLARAEQLLSDEIKSNEENRVQLLALQKEFSASTTAQSHTIDELRAELAQAQVSAARTITETERLRTEVATTTIQLESERTARAELKTASTQDKKELDRLRADLALSLTNSARLEASAVGQAQLLEQVRANEKRLESALESISAEKFSLAETLELMREKLEISQEALSESRSNHSLAEQANKDLKSALEKLKQQLAEAQELVTHKNILEK